MYPSQKAAKSRRQSGQGLVEYVALTALIAIVSIGTVKLFGNKVRSRLNQITNTFDRNIQQGLRSKSTKSKEDQDGPGSTVWPNRGRLPGGIRLPKGF